MTRKTRPYLFYDTTTSVCDECLRPVEAKILFKDRRVYMTKYTPLVYRRTCFPRRRTSVAKRWRASGRQFKSLNCNVETS